MQSKPLFLALAASAAIFALLAANASGDLGVTGSSPTGPLATVDAATLVPADSSTTSSDSGQLFKGAKYKLFGTAARDADPLNPANQVVSFDTSSDGVAGLYRPIGDHVKVHDLDNQVELKYLYVGRTCGAGSTRFQLGIDRNGDGTFDGNAFGYIGDKPFGGLCPSGAWTFEDMTNDVPKWDLSQFGGGMTETWSQMESFFDTVYPNHRVLDAVLVDDSSSFFTGDRGCAYFDLVSTGGRTLTDFSDTDNAGTTASTC